MLNIVLTLDYEIFGKGTGNVKKHIIEPTEKILKICEKYNVPLTIMFEVMEYFKFKEYGDFLEKDLGYSPAKLMESQIINAFKKGHDIQLHIHPQWIDAKYQDGKWIIDNPKKFITELSQNEINKLLTKGKITLENMLIPFDKNYKCNAIRLTNMPWTEAPLEVIPAMKKNGIVAHSLSVSNSPKNNKKGYWSLDSEEKVFEFPIHSIEVKKYKMLTPKRVRAALYRRKYTKDTLYTENIKSKSSIGKLLSIFTENYSLKWDFCKESSREMIYFLEKAMERYDYENYEVPLVMIGHSKDFFNGKEFDKFLKNVKNNYILKQRIKFSCFQEFIQTHIS